MKHKMAMTKNVKRFFASIRELQDRSLGVEGMGLLWGIPGEGKSTVVAHFCNHMGGIYLRARRTWSISRMLGAIMTELGLEPIRFVDPMVDEIIKRLMERPRPVFIDEADYLFCRPGMFDALRDIYDMTGSPVVMIGIEEMARKIQMRGKFARRITQWIEFRGIDLADARELVVKCCEVGVADDLLAHLHGAAQANIGRMTTGLARIEAFGKTNGLSPVTLSDWGDRALFYDQPRFRRPR